MQGCGGVDAFAATRLAAGTAFLVVAAASDLRTRRVRNPLWIGLGTLGLVVLVVELFVESAPWPTWSLAGSAALLFYAVFFGRPLFDEDCFHVRPGRIFLYLAAAAMWIAPVGSVGTVASSVPIVELASMPVMVVLYELMLRARLLGGGADAKCLMALTLLVPTYPDASPFPGFTADPRVQPAFQAIFPFSFVVLVDAAVLQLVVPVGLFIYNLTRGDIGIQSFLGYRAPLDPFPKHVRLMERITDRGEHVVVLRPKRESDPTPEIAKLRAAGIRRAWVTPWVPFMVPLLGGFLLAFLAGNLLVAVLSLAR